MVAGSIPAGLTHLNKLIAGWCNGSTLLFGSRDWGSNPCPAANLLMNYFVYILRTSSNTLYVGQTNNLEKRIKEHKEKSPKSAKYIRYFDSFELVYHEKHSTRSEAMKKEASLKKLSKAKKEALIAGRGV